MTYAISQNRFINHFINHAMSHGARHLQQQFLSQQLSALQQSFARAMSAVFSTAKQARISATPAPHTPSEALSGQPEPKLNPSNRSAALLARFV